MSGRVVTMAAGFWALVGLAGGLAPIDPAGMSRAHGAERVVKHPGASAEAKRRWALARMDEMSHERLRCRERFRLARQVSECEAQFNRRFRQYNEIYLEASRE
jgi:hypothetical protein